MADIPDQAITGRVEHGMDGGGQFDDTQPGPQMAAGSGNSINHFRAHFFCQLGQLVITELLDIRRHGDTIKQWRDIGNSAGHGWS